MPGARYRVPRREPTSITMNKRCEDPESRLAAIVASSDDAIVSKDLDGVITSWNRAAEQMFGFSAAEAIGSHISLIVPDDRLAEEAFVLSQVRSGVGIRHFETRRRRKDGTFIDIDLTLSPIRSSDGEVIGPPRWPATSPRRSACARLPTRPAG